MRPVWKAALVAGGVLLAGAAGAALFAQIGSERKLHRIVAISPQPVAIPDDVESRVRGRYLYESRGCADCHGRDGAGRTVIDGGGMLVRGPNITLGTGSPTNTYTSVDWVRTLRHGVRPNGEPLIVMPSEEYNRMTDGDLGALVSHIRALSPRQGDGRIIRLPLPVRLAYATGIVRDAAEKIDHDAAPSRPIEVGPTATYGAYVANMCMGCHGADMGGGPIAGAPPDWPPAADLRPGAVMVRYSTVESFSVMLHSGKRPDGSAISVMPFESLAELDDTETRALYAFLRELPMVVHKN